MPRHIAAVLLLAMLPLAFLAGCSREDPLSPAFVERMWASYVADHISPQGYVVDRQLGRVTSEGQSYALLRAVWMRDRATFDRVLTWTDSHLKRPDGLYAWLWNPHSQSVVDDNTATDGDQDIAFALILAGQAFGEPAYTHRAVGLIQAIRRTCALELPDGWMLSAGNWAGPERVVNLSYFIPYAYPYFQALDPEGDWLTVRDTGYRLLARLPRDTGWLLPPDFMILAADGAIQPLPVTSRHPREFSFDAVRIFWRVALDCRLSGHKAACQELQSVDVMARLHGRDRGFGSRYGLDGGLLDCGPSLSFAGALLPAFQQRQPELARSLLTHELSASSIAQAMGQDHRYYDLNWVWFGLALANGLIVERTPPVNALR